MQRAPHRQSTPCGDEDRTVLHVCMCVLFVLCGVLCCLVLCGVLCCLVLCGVLCCLRAFAEDRSMQHAEKQHCSMPQAEEHRCQTQNYRHVVA